jgi:predicted nucleic acid-binding protein
VIAVLDANVLYSAPVRDLLLQLAFSGVFQARWSAEIENEWTRNLLADRPELATRIPLTQARMRNAILDALVTDYESLIPGLTLPDPDDRHVLAAAITAAADVIVTFNLKDFPATALSPHGIEAQHPDEFLRSFITAMPSRVLDCVRTCLIRLGDPPISAVSYLGTMRRVGLPETAAFLDQNLTHWHP